ncbi:YihY/virulence factor BrkB family protein [Humibacter sp. BT305]|nr:YihY/virulence factor BrkB family protein [Humibacter sp. BT305]
MLGRMSQVRDTNRPDGPSADDTRSVQRAGDAAQTRDDDQALTRTQERGRPTVDVDEKKEPPEKPKSGLQRLIARVMALKPVRVFLRFSASGGELMASGTAFQAVFAIFAGIWVGFSVFGIVLAGNPDLQAAVIDQLGKAIPGLIGDSGAIKTDALQQAGIFGWTGAIALVGLVLTAVGWLATTRDAIRRIFTLDPPKTNPVLLKLKDFGLALGFGVAIIASAAASIVSTLALTFILGVLRIDEASPVAIIAGQVVGILIVFAFDSFVLAVAFRVLSGIRIPMRRLIAGAMLGGAGLGVLKILGSALLGGATNNPLLASFAVIIGIMIFLNLVCRVILLSATWIAVGMEDAGLDPRALTPEEQEAERERRVADARDVLLAAERTRLEEELAGARGLRRRRVRKQLEKLDELQDAEHLELRKR